MYYIPFHFIYSLGLLSQSTSFAFLWRNPKSNRNITHRICVFIQWSFIQLIHGCQILRPSRHVSGSPYACRSFSYETRHVSGSPYASRSFSYETRHISSSPYASRSFSYETRHVSGSPYASRSFSYETRHVSGSPYASRSFTTHNQKTVSCALPSILNEQPVRKSGI
jgi:hypothetical protein